VDENVGDVLDNIDIEDTLGDRLVLSSGTQDADGLRGAHLRPDENLQEKAQGQTDGCIQTLI
jgi:hypothetical protein